MLVAARVGRSRQSVLLPQVGDLLADRRHAMRGHQPADRVGHARHPAQGGGERSGELGGFTHEQVRLEAVDDRLEVGEHRPGEHAEHAREDERRPFPLRQRRDLLRIERRLGAGREAATRFPHLKAGADERRFELWGRRPQHVVAAVDERAAERDHRVHVPPAGSSSEQHPHD